MNTGQTLLSVAAFLLLGVIILRINGNIAATDNVVLNTKFNVLGVSLASSLVEEASNKAFDQASNGNAISNLTQLTAPGLLGPENNETLSSFNDCDDFNNYDTTITDLPSAHFHLHCTVSYVDPSNPNVSVNYATWNKKITVCVTSSISSDTIKVESIFSYFYFR